MKQPPSELSVSEARDQLRTLVHQVATTEARVRLTHYGHPAGVLLSVKDNANNLQMHIGGAYGVTDAVTAWAKVRDAARTHPQALVLPSQGMAVLLGPELEYRLDHGHPPLPAEELTFTGESLIGPDGTPVPPGTYSIGGQVVTVSADSADSQRPQEAGDA